MPESINKNDVFGFIRPGIDAHTLGISNISKLLEDCGYKVFIGDHSLVEAVSEISRINNIDILIKWIRNNNISCIGFSYRLDPGQAQLNFGKLYYQMQSKNMLLEDGGPVKKIFFAGLPEACTLIRNEYQGRIEVFIGDETPLESLKKIGIPDHLIPASVLEGSSYDKERFSLAKALIEKEEYKSIIPADRSDYPSFGTFSDTVVERINYAKSKRQYPLMRVHVGPYNPNYKEAVKEFISWVKQLANDKFLDIVSIGSSQLSQSHFGKDWKDLPNGGGVPVNSINEYHDIWKAGRPMLFRTYAGTQNIPQLAKTYEMAMNICWHALSLWWFCKIDGRGPNTVMENLNQHLETLEFIAQSNKPFEPNIPHHFAFRGGDDVSYVVSAYLAAKTAKAKGVKTLILQNMLNTPKYTWGVQDLAKSRVMLKLVKGLEDKNFKVFLQPRAGLDFFSPDLMKAKMQLASVSALMDDIDPLNEYSPEIVHVVSYSEASHLATPQIIKESIQITIQAIKEYRMLRSKNIVENMAYNKDVLSRETYLFNEATELIKGMEKSIPDLYSANGLYKAFAAGFLVTPYLWEGKDEFKNAIKWKTSLIKGSVKTVDNNGNHLKVKKRLEFVMEDLKHIKLPA
jgi:hypothetical protein